MTTNFFSGSGFLGVLASDHNEVFKPENGLESRMEVGLITGSVSDDGFNPVNNLGKLKRDEPGLLGFSAGEGREQCSAAMGGFDELEIPNFC